MFGTYKKFAVAIFGALVMTGYQFFDDSMITNLEWVQIVAAGVGAALVWITANGPIGTFWRYAKLVSFTLSAVLVTLYTTLPGGLNSNEIFTIVISALTALGVLGARNEPEAVVVREV